MPGLFATFFVLRIYFCNAVYLYLVVEVGGHCAEPRACAVRLSFAVRPLAVAPLGALRRGRGNDGNSTEFLREIS